MSIIAPSRRGLITGIASLIAAPAVVRVASLMPISVPKPPALYWFSVNDVLSRGHDDLLVEMICRNNALVDYLVKQGRAGSFNG